MTEINREGLEAAIRAAYAGSHPVGGGDGQTYVVPQMSRERIEAAIRAYLPFHSADAGLVEALIQAEACLSVIEPRSQKAEYLRVLDVVRAAIRSQAPAGGDGEKPSVDGVAYAKVRVDTTPDEHGFCFCTPCNHPGDIARGLKEDEWNSNSQFFGQVYASPLAPAAVGEGWQPIESAPKDGTQILLHGLVELPSIDAGEETTAVGYWADMNGGGWVWHGAPSTAWTHWMPLPEAPAASRPTSEGEA